VERAFRDRESPVRAMVATSTVAAGVNTPVETVVIVETEFPGPTPEPYTVAVYKNMAGRAGRLGLVTQGRSILLAENGVHRARLFARYVRGQPEAIRSSFDPADLDTWVLRLLAQVEEVPRDAVVTLLANTYAGYLETRASQTWEPQMRGDVEDLLQQMVELGLLEEEMGLVRLSLLGKACGRSHLRLRSAMRLVELLRRSTEGTLSAETLLALIHALPEFDEAYTPMFRKSQREAEWQRHVTQHFGADVTRALQFGAPDPMAYHARCKRVAVLRAWIDGVPISEIETTFTVNSYVAPVAAGNIRSFNEFARFHLAAAFEIADVLALGHGPRAEDVERLLVQLEAGIPAGAVELLDLPIPLARGAYLALHQAGLVRPDALWEQTAERLREVVGSSVAANLEAVRPRVEGELVSASSTQQGE
jgi:replicative superfamily II helicase